MRITEVVKGDLKLANSQIKVVSTEVFPQNGTAWLVGYGDAPTEWASPKQITAEAASYLRGLSGLQEPGPQRLAYFLSFLGHNDELVATDAYNEFAEATMEDIAALKDKLDRKWVIDQLGNASEPVPPPDNDEPFPSLKEPGLPRVMERSQVTGANEIEAEPSTENGR